MGKKLVLLAGVAVGYVLGTRAGRERYEELRRAAARLWRSPQVQDAATHVEDAATETANRAAQAVKDQVHEVQDLAHEKVHGSRAPSSSTPADIVTPHHDRGLT